MNKNQKNNSYNKIKTIKKMKIIINKDQEKKKKFHYLSKKICKQVIFSN